MISARLLAGILVTLVGLYTAFPARGEGSAPVSPEESLRQARVMIHDGHAAEALHLLRRTEEEFPDWPRRWELRVLAETSRQMLGEVQPHSVAVANRKASRLRIAQVLLFEGESIEDIAANLSRLKGAGVDTVFIRVFHNYGDRPLIKGGPASKSGVYFQTEAAPVLADYLSLIVPVCRRLGLSVFAWMTTRRSEWLLSERPDLAETAFDPDTGLILASSSLNIFHARVRATLIELYRDLAAYDIDGILFQDDLVLRTGEGFSPEALAAYMEDGGAPVSPESLFRIDGSPSAAPLFSPVNYRPAFWKWAAWKNRRLLDLALDLMTAARQVRPGLRFALNLYYEAVLNPRMALAWYAQDLRTALGYPFNYFSLMSYHRQIGKELSLSGDETLAVLSAMSRRAVDTVGNPEKVIMKIQALDWDTSRLIPREELDQALEAATPVDGISLAFVRSISDPPLDIIRKHFRPDGE